ncbi:uncharacterized protein SPPG_01338 [Spizellomyces punctatus DAOM BR117]|uniref:Reelin domain-containing protein n=1 Tax=Spizellomyces punctatus (strain DAOM BR117) TaxID=645134 RepID=A0A0L0HSM9_SPIPD|nr:uncharacterized protein SPPG_01338 [Spizellomyces punctatus DAOM BR117]KND03884.1 hypothetical protein SPPG_01338 [Spizellomyces punctatus DAOM BR117]|eukprot:XP_016611923.1 hypothetical protein SPPG_01338 [Spizellomyces punctatus DAOM BR117]
MLVPLFILIIATLLETGVCAFSLDACAQSTENRCISLSPANSTIVQSSYLLLHLTGLSSTSFSEPLNWDGKFSVSITTWDPTVPHKGNFTIKRSVNGRQPIEAYNQTHRVSPTDAFPIYAFKTSGDGWFPEQIGTPVSFTWKFEAKFGAWERNEALTLLPKNDTAGVIAKPDVPAYSTSGVGREVAVGSMALIVVMISCFSVLVL